jgi:hypothetical protein
MRTTIELPDELMTRAKVRAAQEGVTLKELFVAAVERRVGTTAPPEPKKHRRGPPVIHAPGFRVPTREEIAEAMTPIEHIIEDLERRRR